MGLLKTTHNHFNRIDDSVSIRFPDTIKVHEHKAPTDESVRLMEEMHDKAIKNIVAKVEVTDNMVNGKAWVIKQPWHLENFKLVFKFSINGREFNIERQVATDIMTFAEQRQMLSMLEDYAKAVMLFYTLKTFTVSVYEQISGKEFPKELLG